MTSENPDLELDPIQQHQKELEEADFLVRDEGTLVLLTPVSDEGEAWAFEHLPEDVTMFGDAIVIEHRYAYDILEGIHQDGLKFTS